jgi:Rrf2 family protein
MLRLTRKADYGLIALSHLAAGRPGSSASAKQIAGAHRLPLPLLAKVLQKLARQGLIRSVQGTHGGYRLAREATLISVFEVVKAIDGPVVLTSCVTESGHCGQSRRCTVREPLRRVHKGILDLLAGIKISDLVGSRATPGTLPVLSGQ